MPNTDTAITGDKIALWQEYNNLSSDAKRLTTWEQYLTLPEYLRKPKEEKKRKKVRWGDRVMIAFFLGWMGLYVYILYRFALWCLSKLF